MRNAAHAGDGDAVSAPGALALVGRGVSPSTNHKTFRDVVGEVQRIAAERRMLPKEAFWELVGLDGGIFRTDMLALETWPLVYEALLGKTESKKGGKFYTPPALAREISRAALDGLPPDVRVMDPACGGGTFLLAVLEHKAARRPGEIDRIVRNELCGIDIDDGAVFLTRLLVREMGRRLGGSATVEPRVVIGNFLVEPSDCGGRMKHSALCVSEAMNFAERVPDVIIGNPPYGISRDEQIVQAEKEILMRRFAAYRMGKVNKYLAFLARAFELVPTGGRVTMLVPNAWLGIPTARGMRRHLLAARAFERIHVFEKPPFPRASVETVVVSLRKDEELESFGVTEIRRDGVWSSRPRAWIEARGCLASPEAAISIVGDHEVLSILNRLVAGANTVGSTRSPFVPSIAMQAYAVGKGVPPQTKEDVRAHVYHAREPGDGFIRYYEGRDIARYRAEWSGSFLKYGPWLAEAQPLERFSGPRIAVREILGAAPYLLQATLLVDVGVYNKSVLHIRPKSADTSDCEISLSALLAVLNSKIGSALVRAFGVKTQRALFPKLLNADLRGFPLPGEFEAHAQKLAELARRRAGRGHDDELEKDIERAVAESYGVNSSEYRILERWIGPDRKHFGNGAE